MPDASEAAARARISRPVLGRLSTVPRWLVVVGVAVLFLVGLAVDGWLGAVALLMVLALLAALTAAGWPTLPVGGRLLRCALIGVLLLAAANKLRG